MKAAAIARRLFGYPDQVHRLAAECRRDDGWCRRYSLVRAIDDGQPFDAAVHVNDAVGSGRQVAGSGDGWLRSGQRPSRLGDHPASRRPRRAGHCGRPCCRLARSGEAVGRVGDAVALSERHAFRLRGIPVPDGGEAGRHGSEHDHSQQGLRLVGHDDDFQRFAANGCATVAPGRSLDLLYRQFPPSRISQTSKSSCIAWVLRVRGSVRSGDSRASRLNSCDHYRWAG